MAGPGSVGGALFHHSLEQGSLSLLQRGHLHSREPLRRTFGARREVSGLSTCGGRSVYPGSGGPAQDCHGAAPKPTLPSLQVATDCPTALGNCPMVSKTLLNGWACSAFQP